MVTVHGQQHSFSAHERMFLRKCQIFRDNKWLDLRGTRTCNFRIHAEYFNYLSYQGQTFRHTNGCFCESVKYFETENVPTWEGLESPTFVFMPNTLAIWAIKARHLLARATAAVFDTRKDVLVKVSKLFVDTGMYVHIYMAYISQKLNIMSFIRIAWNFHELTTELWRILMPMYSQSLGILTHSSLGDFTEILYM